MSRYITLLQLIENTAMADPMVGTTDDYHLPYENITDVISNVTEDLDDDDNNVTDSVTAAPGPGFEISI